MMEKMVRRNCQRGRLPACRAVVKRKGKAGECEVNIVTITTIIDIIDTTTITMVSIMITNPVPGVSHDQQQVHSLQVPPLPQV